MREGHERRVDDTDLRPTLPLSPSQPTHSTTNVTSAYTPFDYAATAFPCLRWLRGYNPRSLIWDLAAGASVAALVVPQGMSYARLAGLPQEYGLYGAFVPVMVYAALGSSKHLAVGPVAVTSLILGSSLPSIVAQSVPGFKLESDPNRPANPDGQAVYNRTAIQVTFLAGLLYTSVGILRLGFFVNFLSHSVIAGFMTGAATTIALTQLRYAFGYDNRPNPAWTKASPKSVAQFLPFPRGQADDRVVNQLRNLFSKEWLAMFKWRDFVMTVSWLLLLLAMKELGKRSRRLVWLKALGPLTVTIVSTLITWGFHLGCDPKNKAFNPKCVRVVGKVPHGLPHQTVTWLAPMPNLGAKFGLAILVCAIDVLESISIAKALAFKNRYELNNTQELTGLGLANIVGSFFQCYTTTGSFSRSAIMDNVGATSQIAGWTGGILVMLVLLFLTPAFAAMPQNAQGAIIMSAVLGLLQFREWWFLWRINKLDWLVFTAAVLGVLFAGVEVGLAIAIGLSILLALFKSAFPHTAVLGRLPGTDVYRNVKQYASARTEPGLLAVRVDAPLFFANVAPVADALRTYEKDALAADPTLKAIVVDLSPVIDFDASAVHWLASYVRSARARGIDVALANPSCRVAKLLARAGVDRLVGRDHVYVRVGDAVTAMRAAPRLPAKGGDARAPSRDDSPAPPPPGDKAV